MVRKILTRLIVAVAIILAILIAGMFWAYKPVVEGTLYLKNAMGTAEVLRETETGIPHVYASNELMAIYTEGFLHAQDRLWQMERMRRMAGGRFSEVVGDKAIGIDKFFRTIGIRGLAEQAYKDANAFQKEYAEAYAAGVNDYV